MDIFEKLKSELNCENISDLRFEPYLSRAKESVRHMELGSLSTAMLKDLVEYLYRVHEEERDNLLGILKG